MTLPAVYGWTQLMAEIEVYLAMRRCKGRRESTLRTYRGALKSVFLNLENMQGIVPDPRSISSDTIHALRDFMPICDCSKKLYLLVLGRFVEYLTGCNPYREADVLWNEDQQRRLFISANQFKVMMYRADPLERIILSLGAYMGLRRSEIAGLTLNDISEGHLRVKGKGHGPDGKVVRLFIPVQVQKELDRWMVERRKLSSSTGPLLLVSGMRGVHGLSGNGVGYRMKKLGRRCGIDLTAHSLRRLFCTTLWDAGVDANTVRLMMRHQSLDTTMKCYIKANPDNFQEARMVLGEVLG